MRIVLLALVLAVGCTQSFPGSASDAELLILATRLSTQNPLSSSASSAASPSCASSAFCYTFRTNGLPSASFGGVAGADAVCNADVNKPAGAVGTFKALLADPQNNLRRASVTANLGDGQVDWVLQANKEYRRSNGIVVVGISNAQRLFTFALTNSFVTAMGGHWTGLAGNWTNDALHCLGWSTTAGSGRDGADNSNTNTAISNAGTLCNTAGPTLICIEQ